MAEVRIKLDSNTIQKIALFEAITKANLKDCVDEEDEVTFVVGQGDFGKAIGRGGANAKLLERKFNKRTNFVEFNPEPEKFAANILRPIPVKCFELVDKNMIITIKSSQRAFPSKKVKKTKILLKKYFPSIEEVTVKV